MLLPVFIYGQENNIRNFLKTASPILATGFSAGIQGISIPPLQTKFSVGFIKKTKNFEYYVLPGLTVGIAPTGLGHIELGVLYESITLDYSANWQQISGENKYYHNQNINFGYQVKLNRKKQNNLRLWLNVGKAIYSSGYNTEFPVYWNGISSQLRLLWRYN